MNSSFYIHLLTWDTNMATYGGGGTILPYRILMGNHSKMLAKDRHDNVYVGVMEMEVWI
jgi:hypothetical protein